MQIRNRLTTATILASFLLAQLAPIAAFAQAPKPPMVSAQPAPSKNTPAQMLKALLQLVGKNAAFTAPRRGSGAAAAGTGAQLSEAEVAPVIGSAVDILISSLSGLVSHSAETASQVAQVSSELVSANDVTPIEATKQVISLGLTAVMRGFTHNLPQDMAAAIPLMEWPGGLTFAAPRTPQDLLTKVIATPAYAAGPQQANWQDFQRKAAGFLSTFRNMEQVLRSSFVIPTTAIAIPDISRIMREQRIPNLDAALNAAVAAGNAQDGRAAGDALDAAGGIINDMLVLGRMVNGKFLISLIEFVGLREYNIMLDLLAPVQQYALYARLLPPAPKAPGAPLNIISDPRDTIRRAEQIGISEMDKKIVQLANQFDPTINKAVTAREEQLKSQLQKNPNDAAIIRALAELMAGRDELETLRMIQRAEIFAYSNVKEPALACNVVDKCAMVRKIKEFNVSEVVRILNGFTDGIIKDAEKSAMQYHNWPASVIDNAKNGVGQVFKEDQGKYGDDPSQFTPPVLYRHKKGRLYYDLKNPNDVATGIFKLGYGNAYVGSDEPYPPAVRVRQAIMVISYVVQDALETWALDCKKPPSAIVAEVMEKVSQYIDATSVLSKDGAKDKLNEVIATTLAKYKDGLVKLLSDMDARYNDGVIKIVENIAAVNGSFTTMHPDVTGLLNSIPPALKALQALTDSLGSNVKVPTWVDMAQVAANKGIAKIGGGEPLPASPALADNCPKKPQPAKQCKKNLTKFALVPEGRNICGVTPGSSENDQPGFRGAIEVQYTTEAGALVTDPARYPGRAGGAAPAGLSCEATGGYCCDQGEWEPPINGGAVGRWICKPSVWPEVTHYDNVFTVNNAVVGKITVAWCMGLPRMLTEGECPLTATPEMANQVCNVAPSDWTDWGQGDAQCGSAADLKNVKELLNKCLSGKAGAKASLAELWDAVKKSIKNAALENLQKQFDAFPDTIGGIVKLFVRGKIEEETATKIAEIRATKYVNAGAMETHIKEQLEVGGDIIHQLGKINFNRADFARYWSPLSGPDIRDYSFRNNVSKKVFDVIYKKLDPIIYRDSLLSEANFSLKNSLPVLKYEAAGIGAVIVAFSYDMAKEFNEKWGSDDQGLHDVITGAISKTKTSVEMADIFPGLVGSVAPVFFLNDIEELFDANKSSVPYIKKLYNVADNIDVIMKRLQDFSEKDVEFQTAVTACGNTYKTGKDITDLMSTLSAALAGAKKGTVAYAIAQETDRISNGLDATTKVVSNEAPQTQLEKDMQVIAMAILKQLADERVAQLKAQLR